MPVTMQSKMVRAGQVEVGNINSVSAIRYTNGIVKHYAHLVLYTLVQFISLKRSRGARHP